MGWNLFNFLMDVWMGFGCFYNFWIFNYNLMMVLIDYCIYVLIDEIL